MRFVSKRDRGRGVARHVTDVLTCLTCLSLTCCLVLAGPSRAQSLTDGPLAASGTPAPSKPIKGKPATHAKSSSAKTRAAKATNKNNAKAADLDDGSEATASPASKPAPRKPVAVPTSDPLSLGMKWNGSNDSAEQTRIQNYGGTATGTGASVGLNYHF